VGQILAKAIKAPRPRGRVLCQQEVFLQNEDNLKGWFDAGATSVVLGLRLISNETFANKDSSLRD